MFYASESKYVVEASVKAKGWGLCNNRTKPSEGRQEKEKKVLLHISSSRSSTWFVWYMVQNIFQIEHLPINTANLFGYNVVQGNQLNLLKYCEYLNIFWFAVKQQITQHPEFVFLDECVSLLSVWNWEDTSYHNTHKLKQLPTPV